MRNTPVTYDEFLAVIGVIQCVCAIILLINSVLQKNSNPKLRKLLIQFGLLLLYSGLSFILYWLAIKYSYLQRDSSNNVIVLLALFLIYVILFCIIVMRHKMQNKKSITN